MSVGGGGGGGGGNRIAYSSLDFKDQVDKYYLKRRDYCFKINAIKQLRIYTIIKLN